MNSKRDGMNSKRDGMVLKRDGMNSKRVKTLWRDLQRAS